MEFRRFIIPCVTFPLLLIQLMCSICWADSSDDFYIQQALAHYFLLPQDPRSLAMGGSSAVVCGDVSCMYSNPAGLAYLPQPEAVISLNRSEQTGDEFLEGGNR